MPSRPFSFTTLLKYTMQLEWLTSAPSPDLSTLLFSISYAVTRDNMLLTGA